MSTCKDCLHNDVCHFTFKGCELTEEEKKDCGFFKPKADYVEVVHCGDCENCREFNKFHKYCTEHSDGWGNSTVYVEDDDYCSFGIKKKAR